MAIFGPVGQYTNVYVYEITGGGAQLLAKGTGTLSGAQTTFSCGEFDSSFRPEVKVNIFYKITGENGGNSYEEAPLKCVHSGATSDFTA